MKKIDLENLNDKNEHSLTNFIYGGLNMEFIKKGKNYLVKDSNGIIVSEKEKLELENKELILNDISSNKCQEETTKKIKKNKKKIKEIEEQESDK